MWKKNKTENTSESDVSTETENPKKTEDSNLDFPILEVDFKQSREEFEKETGKKAIYHNRQTNSYKQWLLKKGDVSKEPKSEEVKPEKIKSKKEPKEKVVSWKDQVTEEIDEALDNQLKDLRKDLRDFIIGLRTKNIVLENKLKELTEKGFIAIVYGRPGIGKSVFCASGVLDGYTVILLDVANQGRRLQQFKEIYQSKNLLYEAIDERNKSGKADLSKNFEKIDYYVGHCMLNHDPKTTIIVIDGWSKVIKELNSYLRSDILGLGDPKSGRQSDVPYGDWYWRSLRYNQLLFSMEIAANNGFRIFLTAEVKDVVEVTTDRGKLKITKTGERAPNVRDDDLFTVDIEAFFRNSYDPEKDEIGPREIEIKTSKVPGIIEGTIIVKPKMKDFLDLRDNMEFKKLDFGE